MISFERAGEVLDAAAESLPEGIFEGLNGGINLMADAVKASNGSCTLGRYFRNSMGRYIEIYLGSFEELYGDRPDSYIEDQLVKTLHHELTHHIEDLAGDRTLERDDEEYAEECRRFDEGEPMVISSVLFVDEDGCSLSQVCAGLMQRLSEENGLGLTVRAAGMKVEEGAFVREEAVYWAEEYGACIAGAGVMPVTREMLAASDVIFCMTEEMADRLASMWPRYDARIFALGEEDIKDPVLPEDWEFGVEKAADALDAFCSGLCAEDIYE